MNIERNKNSGYIVIRSLVIVLTFVVILLSVLAGVRGGRAEARDSQRLKDVGSITQALKLYQEYNLLYPESANFLPKDLSSYIEYWPQAPKPADGLCSEQANLYAYERLDGGQSYHLSFCLGKRLGGYGPGLVTIKP